MGLALCGRLLQFHVTAAPEGCARAVPFPHVPWSRPLPLSHRPSQASSRRTTLSDWHDGPHPMRDSEGRAWSMTSDRFRARRGTPPSAYGPPATLAHRGCARRRESSSIGGDLRDVGSAAYSNREYCDVGFERRETHDTQDTEDALCELGFGRPPDGRRDTQDTQDKDGAPRDLGFDGPPRGRRDTQDTQDTDDALRDLGFVSRRRDDSSNASASDSSGGSSLFQDLSKYRFGTRSDNSHSAHKPLDSPRAMISTRKKSIRFDMSIADLPRTHSHGSSVVSSSSSTAGVAKKGLGAQSQSRLSRRQSVRQSVVNFLPVVPEEVACACPG